MAETKELKVRRLARAYAERFYNLDEDQPIDEADEIRCNSLSEILLEFAAEIEERGLVGKVNK